MSFTEMHASSLLKAVLKPRNITSNSSGQSLNTSKAERKPRSPLSSPDKGVSSLTVSNKSAKSAVPAKMSCLCAPTTHAGSFRCRLHRGSQQQWGGRPLAPAAAPKPSSPSSPTSTDSSSSSDSGTAVTGSETGSSKRVVSSASSLPSVPASRLASTTSLKIADATSSFKPSDARLSRLSKVVVAPEPIDGLAPRTDASTAPLPTSDLATKAYLKFNSGSAAVAIRKLQASTKDVMFDVFASGAGLSQRGLSL